MVTVHERSPRFPTVIGSALLFLSTACGSTAQDRPLNTPNQDTSGAASSGETLPFTGSLSAHMSPDIISLFELQKLAGVPVETYELKTADGKPTFVYVQDRSISINPLEIQQAIDAFTGERSKTLINSLKVGRIPNVDFVENNPNPGTTTFRYDYSIDSKIPPMGVVPVPFSEDTQERHFIIIKGGEIPGWATIGDAVTKGRRVGPEAEKAALVTILNTEKLLKRSGDPDYNLNLAMHVEICQQTNVLFAVESGSGVIAPQAAVSSRIAKEGVSNAFGIAANQKRLGSSWEIAKATIDNGVFSVPATELPPFKYFPITKAFYNQLPSGDLLLTIKR